MKNQKKEINASSMADIAFLLLIFFLVSTTIEQDKGLLNKLPPIETEKPQAQKERNVLEILINANNKVLVEQEYMALKKLKAITVKHIENNGFLQNFSEAPTKAIISLKNHRGTSYETYLMVQNELKAAYNEVRNKEAMILSNQKYNYKALKNCVELREKGFEYCLELKNKVKNKFPMIISEAEPFGQL